MTNTKHDEEITELDSIKVLCEKLNLLAYTDTDGTILDAIELIKELQNNNTKLVNNNVELKEIADGLNLENKGYIKYIENQDKEMKKLVSENKTMKNGLVDIYKEMDYLPDDDWLYSHIEKLLPDVNFE